MIQLIEGPDPFSVKFLPQISPTKAPEEALSERVRRAVFSALKNIQVIFIIFRDVICDKYANRGLVFRIFFLASPERLGGGMLYTQFPSDLYAASFQFIDGVVTLAYAVAQATYEKFTEKFQRDLFQLQAIAGEEIDIRHFQCSREDSIDASQVPESVKLTDLLGMFDQINFDDPSAPGYINPASLQQIRQQAPVSHTKEELRNSLQNFIDNVTECKPLMGAPPATEGERVKRFYENIANKARFSMNKLNQDLVDFTASNGEIAGYSDEKKRIYSELLETRAQFVRDMAFAGMDCAALYTGSTEMWYRHCRGNALGDCTTLEKTLFALLAREREDIAEKEAYLACSRINQNPEIQEALMTHYYNQYLQTFTPLLALPERAGIDEHLVQTSALPQEALLRLFFKQYNVNRIIESVHAHYKKSEEFSTKIHEWIKDQVGEWKKASYETLCSARIAEIAAIRARALGEGVTDHPILELIYEIGVDRIQVLHKKNQGHGAFVEEVFELDVTKRWLGGKFPSSPLDRHNFKETFSKMLEGLSQEGELPCQVSKRLFRLNQVEEIYEIAEGHVPMATAERILGGEADTLEAVVAASERERKREFLEEVLGDGDAQKTSAWIEWLLVSHHVFFPQPIHKEA